MKYHYITVLAFYILSGLTAVQASVLLSLENFVILGGTAITSTGTTGTVITNGDVGLAPGATGGITGFPPALFQNGVIVATGGVTGQARLDLLTLQTGLALMPPDVNHSGVDMGGMILTPGVYSFDVAASLNGVLVLDGQGLDDAYWVFQVGTSITSSAGSSVSVINPGPSGGSDYGIFWNSGSEIIIGANNAILGNYISGTSITMGAGSSGSGRALALAGVTLDQNAINAFGGPGLSDLSGGLMYDVDGIHIIPVPEPSSALLSGVALLGFLARRSMR